MADLLGDHPVVHFELSFPGPPVGKAAAPTGPGLLVEPLITGGLQPGQAVLELGDLHLNLGFLGLGALGKDF